SGCAARLDAARVPLYEGFTEVVGRGIVSTLHPDNAKMACRVESAEPPAWLVDPQTSGGRLAGGRAGVAGGGVPAEGAGGDGGAGGGVVRGGGWRGGREGRVGFGLVE